MGNMREIRDRIKSINDIMKITNAMYLISSSKLKKAKKDLAATQPYFNKLLYAMRSILSRAPEDIDMRYFDRREEIKPEDRKVGYIVITADKGMCGSYNHNITLNNTLYVLCYGKLTFFGLPLQIRIDGRRLLNACIDNQAFIFSAIFRMFHDKIYGLIISL